MNTIDLLKKANSCNTAVPLSDFNLFTALHIEHREVYLCRFVGEILKRSNTALQSFAEIVCGSSDIFNGNCEIVLEERIDNERRVDIVIKTPNKIYPIEVKVYAEDQPHQLYDYWHYYREKDGRFTDDSKIYYLTPNGTPPSIQSIQSKNNSNHSIRDKVICISFRKEIARWIDSCNEEPYKYVLEQFKEVIDIMCKDETIASEILGNNPYEYLDAFKNLYRAKDAIALSIRSKYIETVLTTTLSQTEYHFLLPSIEKWSAGENTVAIIKKGAVDIATLCIDKNLYIRVGNGCKISKTLSFPHWNSEQWEYLHTANSNNKINLRDPWDNEPNISKQDRFMNLVDLLNSIET